MARTLASSPDGKVIASGHSDGTILLWDATRLPRVKRPDRQPLTAKELDAEWQALRGDNAARAFQALWVLRSVPDLALPLLKQDLRPAAAVDRKRIVQLLKDLDADDFDVREKATEALTKLDDVADEAIGTILDGNPSPEVRRRLQRVLAKSQTALATGDHLRRLRMLELLEQLNSPAADELLKTLGENETDPALAREAKAILARQHRRERE